MKPRHTDVDLDAAYLEILAEQERAKKEKAAARRQQRVLAVLSANPRRGVVLVVLAGRYTTKQIRDVFDLEPDEVQDFLAWLCEENSAARFLGDGVYEFNNLELEIREK